MLALMRLLLKRMLRYSQISYEAAGCRADEGEKKVVRNRKYLKEP